MTNEEQLTSQIYNILSMSDEPLTSTEIAHELRPEVPRAEVSALLNKIVTQYEGVGKGYQPGSFIKVGNKWSVKQLGISKSGEFTTKDLVARLI